MDRKVKLDWNERSLVGVVFLPMGLLFLTAVAVITALGSKVPRDVKLPLTLCFGIMGTAFAVTGAVLLILEIRKKKGREEALAGGDYITAKVAGIRHHGNVGVNGMSPVSVECHWREPGTDNVHVYHSRYYYSLPEVEKGQEVKVYLNRMNDKYYYVDIDELQPRMINH